MKVEIGTGNQDQPRGAVILPMYWNRETHAWMFDARRRPGVALDYLPQHVLGREGVVVTQVVLDYVDTLDVKLVPLTASVPPAMLVEETPYPQDDR